MFQLIIFSERFYWCLTYERWYKNRGMFYVRNRLLHSMWPNFWAVNTAKEFSERHVKDCQMRGIDKLSEEEQQQIGFDCLDALSYYLGN